MIKRYSDRTEAELVREGVRDMTFRIGLPKQDDTVSYMAEQNMPRRSVAEVWFPDRKMHLAYYNDRFDLKRGDIVYVDGKLEGHRGQVTEVNYNFKIRVSDYKRVIAVADTTVSGQFFMAGSHFVTFDRNALPIDKVSLWFKAPNNEDEEFVCGSDDVTFSLDDISEMKVSHAIAERGHAYYRDNRVRYICVDGTKGYAIVEGGEAYEVAFEYVDGRIGKLTCSCFCSCDCKHEVAAMLQLKETLEKIQKHYADEYERTDYFAAICKGTLFEFAIDGKEKGCFTV